MALAEEQRYEGGVCPECYINWKELSHQSNLMAPEKVEYCPIHGEELVD